jgi:hypothetical protein
MAKYALVSPANAIIEFRDYAAAPNAVTSSAIKPRLLPVTLIDVTFDPVSEVRVGPTYAVRANDVTENYTKRAKNAGEIASMKAAKIAAVHFIGEQKLAASVTLAQQVQALTRLVQLLYAHTDTSAWTAGERTLVTVMLNRLANLRDVRAVEDAKVNEVTALSTPAEIAAYDATAGWP